MWVYLLIILVLSRMAYKMYLMLSIVRRLEKQGVKFVGTLPHLSDPKRLYDYSQKYPGEYFFSRMI